MSSDNAINADSGKRRAFVAPLFTAGYGERSKPLAAERQHIDVTN
jgi:hypothetical protein